MAVSASNVKKLRDKTGAGMMECKKALLEAEGDFDKAERILKELGLAAAAKRQGRATDEGRIFTKVHGKKAGILELSCETDFVARNDKFQAMGEAIVTEAVEHNLGPDADELQAKVKEAVSTIKENMGIRRLELMSADDHELIVDYIHGDAGSIGVLAKIGVDNPELLENATVKQFAFDCALHVAAFRPQFLNDQTVPKEYVEEQRQVFRAQAQKLGKPEKVLDGIVTGKLKKHFSEICLLQQSFVKDDKRTVEAVAKEVGNEAGGTVTVKDYRYYMAGEDLS